MEEDRPQTDPSVIEEVKRITAKDVDALTPEDAAFLRARKHYLGRNSRAKFVDVLNAKPEETKQEDPPTATKENKKEAKKEESEKEEKKTTKPEVDNDTANGQSDTDDDEDDGDIEDEDSEKV